MFTELLPMLRNRSLTIFVYDAGDGKLGLNVIPTKLKENEDDQLSVALFEKTIVAPAEDLDKELPAALQQFAANHQTIAEAMAASTSQVEAIKKAADEAVKAAQKDATGRMKKASVPEAKTNAALAAQPAPPPVPSLFDSAPAAPATPASTNDTAEEVTSSEPAEDPKDEETVEGPDTAELVSANC